MYVHTFQLLEYQWREVRFYTNQLPAHEPLLFMTVATSMCTYMHTGWRRGDETPSAGAGGGRRLWQRQNRTRELMIMMIMMKNEKKVKVKVVSGKLL